MAAFSLLRSASLASRLYPAARRFLSVQRDFGAETEVLTRLAHLDYRGLRGSLEEAERNLERRRMKADLKGFAEVFDKQKALSAEISKVRQRRNELSESTKAASTDKALDKEEKAALLKRLSEEGKDLKLQLSNLEKEHHLLSCQLFELADQVPNVTHPSVPTDEPTIVKVVGTKPEFSFKPLSHIELGKSLGIIDFENAAEVSGNSFYYLKGAAAMMELALVQAAFQFCISKGFQPVMAPDVVRTYVAAACGYRPRGEASQVYHITNTDKCLVGTAEIPLAGMYQNQILVAKQLPLNMVAFGHAFRHEVGNRGQETKGLYRVHQFSKVEMFSITIPEESDNMLEKMLAIQTEFFQSLGLHFKVLNMPGFDLGASATKKYDIEAWMPSRNDYGEISSTSNCLDYQSRRLNIRHRLLPNEPTTFVHTVNGTACAIPRVILAILECNQQANGSVKIPEMLRPFMGGMTEIVKKE